MTPSLSRQRGAALIVSLIMLLLITLFAVNAFRMGASNLQVVNNAQQRGQGFAAAQSTVELVASSTQFTTSQTNALPNPCGGVNNTACFDVNGDGVVDENVTVTVVCNSIQPIANSSLDYTNPNDAGCLIGTGQTFGVGGSSSGNSMCSNSVWDLQASATDAVSSANYVIDQGVAVRVPATTTCP